MHRIRLGAVAGSIAILLLASGCFQQVGTGPDGLAVAENLNPTFTPPPSETPFPTPELELPTDTPEALETEEFGTGGPFPTPSPTDFVVAQLPTDDPNAFQEVQPGGEAQPGIDPIYITATFIVQRATQTEAFIQTATAGGPIATSPPIVFETATPDPGQGGGAVAPPVTGSDCPYTVKQGDNLFRIALTYNMDVYTLAAYNNIANPALILINQQITIPNCGGTGPNPNPNPGTGGVYVVQQGDTLFKISLRYGVPVMSIANANGIQNINLILIGQQLTIPAA